MEIKQLSAYIIRNSTQASRSKSYSIHPEIIEVSNDAVEFTYQGSDFDAYNITIKSINNTITTNCTCPYNYSGVCKHIVAAIRLLIAKIERKELQLDSNGNIKVDIKNNTELIKIKAIEPVQAQNQILLPEKEITDDIIKQVTEIFKKNKSNYYYYEAIKLTSVSNSTIESTSGTWKNYQQRLNFNKENNILTFNCSCSRKLQLCEHSSETFLKVVELFGKNFFKENYFDEYITNHLAQYNLTLQDNYQDYFTYELTLKGIVVHSKFKNIKNEVKEIKLYTNEAAEELAFLPPTGANNEGFGYGFVFNFGKAQFHTILVVKAKYNKDKSDFASSFKILEDYGLMKELYDADEQETYSIAQRTTYLNFLIKNLTKENNIHQLNKAIHVFAELSSRFTNYFLYEHFDLKSLVRKNITPITIEKQPLKLSFTLSEKDLFYNLKAKITIGDDTFSLSNNSIVVSNLFVKKNDVIYPITDTDLSVSLSHFKKEPETNYPKKDFLILYNKVILPLSKKYEVESIKIPSIKKKKEAINENLIEKHVYITDDNGEFIIFKPIVNYAGKLVSLFSNEMLTDQTDDGKFYVTERNLSFEDNFLNEMRSLHPDFEEQNHLFYLTPEQLFENHWMLQATEKMKQNGIQIFGANELKSFKYNLNKATINVNLKSDIDWFDVAIEISFGNQKVSLRDVQKAIIKKSNYVTLSDGTIGILPEEWLKKFANYFKVGELKKDAIRLSNFQFGIIDELYLELENKPTFLEELYQKKQRLQHITEIENISIPKGIKANLRDYQQHGLNWLTFLDTNRLGGCLADDMGLGKTLQTITFLMHLKKSNKNIPASLIIAPTSLIFNWKNEIDKFAPSLKILTFVGAKRNELKDKFNDVDIVISTYGSLLNDITFLKDYKFHYVILDESQAIKNPNSKRYKAVRLLNAHNRLVLTGTPIENNTFDLYAQLNFLNPGLLGSINHFKTEFSNAIDKDKDIKTSQLLSTIISPFILRRTKEQVAKELPEKMEEIIYCEMPKEQRSVYDTFKNKYRDYLLNKIEENGVEKSQMYVLEGLTKLRQICNATSLISAEEDYGNYSIKLETLIETIKEKTGNHKILVFSQFVKMLQLIKNRLDDEKISYEYLDGQTTNRQEKVANFQENKSVRVFLISLKAGGTGLNLTEADYVFIVDPWWNPAVENQAIDRCYRIGQSKNVMAYRMICKDTIEEKIMALQQNKKTVASNVISIDDTKKSFNTRQIKELFS